MPRRVTALRSLVAFDGPGGPDERFDQWTAQLENSCRSNGLATILRRHVRRIGRSEVDRALVDTENDLKRGDIRAALGVGYPPLATATDLGSGLYGRLLHLNLASALAPEQSIDVIDHEAGLSWLASLKLVAASFLRNHSTARGINQALAAHNLPDIGRLYQAVG